MIIPVPKQAMNMNYNMPALPPPSQIHQQGVTDVPTAPPTMMVPSSDMQMIPAGNSNTGQHTFPCIWVPHMDNNTLQHVNVNVPPSQDPSGQDLPAAGKTIFTPGILTHVTRVEHQERVSEE